MSYGIVACRTLDITSPIILTEKNTKIQYHNTYMRPTQLFHWPLPLNQALCEGVLELILVPTYVGTPC